MICNNTEIRLAGGSDQYEGRVEICFNETWGTICDGSWSTNDANVACRQLGYAATGKLSSVLWEWTFMHPLTNFQVQEHTLTPSSVKVQDPSTLMIFSVVVLRTVWLTVLMVDSI